MRQVSSHVPRSPAVSTLLIVITIIAGLVIRFAHLGLPPFIVKYGGSSLWAVMIYWIASTLLPGWPLRRAVVCGGIIATGVEILKLYHATWLNSFRVTLPGILLLGRVFSGWDILVYWLAIGAAALMDRWLRGQIFSNGDSLT